MLVDLGCLRMSFPELDGASAEEMSLLLAVLAPPPPCVDGGCPERDCRQEFPLTGRPGKGTSSTISTTSSWSSSSGALLLDHESFTLDDFSAYTGVDLN
jgi:hypothetical protein